MKYRALLLPILALAAGVSTLAPAAALPGNPFKAECAWAKQSAKLSQVNCDSGDEGDFSYVSGYVRQPAWAHQVVFESHFAEKGTIVYDELWYAHPPNIGGIMFAQDYESNGVRLLRAFYGNSITADFLGAQKTAVINKRAFYAGRKFGYEVVSLKNHDNTQFVGKQDTIQNHFYIIEKSQLQQWIKDAAHDYPGV